MKASISSELVRHSKHKPIKNQVDINTTRELMAEGNYPLSMTDCEVVGIHGYCGDDCPVLKKGDCEENQ